MPTTEQLTVAVHNYIESFNAPDIDRLVGLFADNAKVEDPVGTEPKAGHAAIREFYTMSTGMGAKLHLDGPVCATGADYVAYVMHVIVPMETRMRFDVIETFRVNDDGKITEMRAFFGNDNIRPATDTE